MDIERSIPSFRSVDRRQVIYLLIFGIAIFLLLPHLVRFDRFIHLLETANPVFIGLALIVETLRYFFSAGSTIALARLFQRRVPVLPMTEAFFAGAALNRTFSTGGAPGIVVRLLFLMQQGLHAGSVAAIFMIEDIIGLAIGTATFFFGITTLSSTQTIRSFTTQAIIFLISTGLLGLLAIYVLRKRTHIYRIIHYIARMSNRIAERFFQRTIYIPNRVQQTLDDFYAGLHAARLQPQYWIVSSLFNVLRYVSGGAALYFSFHALGDTISPSVLILLYTAASVLSTMSALPGEVAIMGTGFIVLIGSLGLSAEAASLALVLSRTIAFWLPMPVGFLALFHLRRKHSL